MFCSRFCFFSYLRARNNYFTMNERIEGIREGIETFRFFTPLCTGYPPGHGVVPDLYALLVCVHRIPTSSRSCTRFVCVASLCSGYPQSHATVSDLCALVVCVHRIPTSSRSCTRFVFVVNLCIWYPPGHAAVSDLYALLVCVHMIFTRSRSCTRFVCVVSLCAQDTHKFTQLYQICMRC